MLFTFRMMVNTFGQGKQKNVMITGGNASSSLFPEKLKHSFYKVIQLKDQTATARNRVTNEIGLTLYLLGRVL